MGIFAPEMAHHRLNIPDAACRAPTDLQKLADTGRGAVPLIPSSITARSSTVRVNGQSAFLTQRLLKAMAPRTSTVLNKVEASDQERHRQRLNEDGECHDGKCGGDDFLSLGQVLWGELGPEPG